MYKPIFSLSAFPDFNLSENTDVPCLFLAVLFFGRTVIKNNTSRIFSKANILSFRICFEDLVTTGAKLWIWSSFTMLIFFCRLLTARDQLISFPLLFHYSTLSIKWEFDKMGDLSVFLGHKKLKWDPISSGTDCSSVRSSARRCLSPRRSRFSNRT